MGLPKSDVRNLRPGDRFARATLASTTNPPVPAAVTSAIPTWCQERAYPEHDYMVRPGDKTVKTRPGGRKQQTGGQALRRLWGTGRRM